MTNKKPSITEFLQGLFQDKEPQTKEVRIGKVNPKLGDRLEVLITEHQEVHHAMDKKRDLYMTEVKEKAEAFAKQLAKETAMYMNQLDTEHEPFCNEFHKQQELLWEEIYDELNLPQAERTDNHAINQIGVVTRIVEVEDEDEQNHTENGQVH